MAGASVFDVANWFLQKEPMSHKKLQKLTYYAYAWALTLMNDDPDEIHYYLFNDDEPQAWVHGPVFPSLYQRYKSNGWEDISPVEPTVSFSSEEEDILNQVWSIYGDMTGNQLESITHKESPWRNARGNLSPAESCRNTICSEDIFRYYGSL